MPSNNQTKYRSGSDEEPVSDAQYWAQKHVETSNELTKLRLFGASKQEISEYEKKLEYITERLLEAQAAAKADKEAAKPAKK